MRSAAESPEVFEYLDYRKFLRDFYKSRKRNGRGFSYRAFSRRAQLQSPNYLKLVIEGQRNLTGSMANRFANACGLDGDDAAYFENLVQFNQAKTSSERASFYDRLRSFRRYRRVQKLEVDQADYHSTWYLPAIRELAARSDFRDDPEWIAKKVLPPISVSEAKRALDILFRLGLVARGEDGRVRQTDVHVSTGPETLGVHIATYHRTMMERASEAIDLVKATQRDISSLTLCLGPDGLAELKLRIQAFRRELLKLSEDDPSPRQVVQLNMQLFPLSTDEGEE
jgi:uncharacterized protein (TIGR02147 family)